MNVKVAQWGNSVGVRLPKSIASQAGKKRGDSLDISVEESGRIVLRPERPRYTLEGLLAGVTKNNQHAETDWDEPQDKEVW